MPAVTLTLPSLLRDIVGTTEFTLRASTLREAMEQAYRRAPVLRLHLCDERGRFRGHVLCLVNDVNTRDFKSLDVPLSAGDRISIVQAVSGG
jgi:molybdopterin synthase sulfur carrier subunit